MLALEGLEQLTPLDNRLGNYTSKLFSESKIERHLMTKEENQALDAQLSTFLSLLSPFFLLGGTHKVLEYLIRQYQCVFMNFFTHNQGALVQC